MPMIDSSLVVAESYLGSGKAAAIGVRSVCDVFVVLGVCGGYNDGVITAVVG